MPIVRKFFAGFLALLTFTSAAHAQGLIRDAEIERYLREFTDPILESANLRKEDVNIYIINDGTLNAFVANGQNIHLNTGLIMETETPGQLIGVIAHETGHIEGGHGVRRIEDIKVASRPAMLSVGLGILAIAAGAGEAGAALIASSQQFAYLNFAVHTRVQEASADQAALRYMKATGRSPSGLLEFFENFRDASLYNNSERYKYFYTHPLPSERIEALRTGAERTGLMDVPDSAEEIDKLNRMKAKLIGFLSYPQEVNARYPKSDTSIPARYARAISALQNSFTATAISETQSLIADEPDNPFFHELLGQIYYESGQIEKAVPPNRRALELAPNEPLLMINLAISLNARDEEGDLEEAGDLLTVATSREPENAFAWYELSVVREKQGLRGEAMLATAEQAFHYGDCKRALSFSMRALDEIPTESRAHLRASDISKICSANLQNERNR
jgi:predicted Zn-dependent protease